MDRFLHRPVLAAFRQVYGVLCFYTGFHMTGIRVHCADVLALLGVCFAYREDPCRVASHLAVPDQGEVPAPEHDFLTV